MTRRGAGRIRTGGGGFADLCLTTWLRRRERESPILSAGSPCRKLGFVRAGVRAWVRGQALVKFSRGSRFRGLLDSPECGPPRVGFSTRPNARVATHA